MDRSELKERLFGSLTWRDVKDKYDATSGRKVSVLSTKVGGKQTSAIIDTVNKRNGQFAVYVVDEEGKRGERRVLPWWRIVPVIPLEVESYIWDRIIDYMGVEEIISGVKDRYGVELTPLDVFKLTVPELVAGRMDEEYSIILESVFGFMNDKGSLSAEFMNKYWNGVQVVVAETKKRLEEVLEEVLEECRGDLYGDDVE